MAQRAIRCSETTDKRIHEATEKRGFSSPTAYIRCPVDQELSVDIYLTQVATTCSMAADGGISAQPPGI
jgi:hypothetical protein